jgi:hypothetical protein
VRAQPGIDSLTADEVGFALVEDGEALLKTDAGRLLSDDIMCQAMQRADAISVEGVERIIKKSPDTGFKVIDRRVDEGDNKHFLLISERAAGNDLCSECREDLRLTRTRHRGNAKPPAAITEDLFL